MNIPRLMIILLFCEHSLKLAFARNGNLSNVVSITTTTSVSNTNVTTGTDISLSGDFSACSVFCEGNILETVQLASLFNDSKTFVDKPLLLDPQLVLQRFNEEVPLHNASKTQIQKFVARYFGIVGEDLQVCHPQDFNPSPPKITQNISVPASRKWALALNAIWPQLCREVTPAAKQQPTRHTLLTNVIHHPMIVPGGRFRESYYWDTYWILKGLLISDMHQTACGVVGNLLAAVEEYGFVPNGFREYYLTRSQPPLLSDMVKFLLDAITSSTTTNTPSIGSEIKGKHSAHTSQTSANMSSQSSNRTFCGYSTKQQFLVRWLPVLRKEYAFWMTNRSIQIPQSVAKGFETFFKLNIYNASTNAPRPESFKEDYSNGILVAAQAASKGLNKTMAMHSFFKGIGSVAESGYVI